jgi:hypothetical protein
VSGGGPAGMGGAAAARAPSLPGDEHAVDVVFGDADGESRGADDAGRAPDAGLVLLTTPAMRARRHPRAVVAMWAWQAVVAALVAWPAAGLAQAAWGGDVHGDAALWAPGAHALLDWLWHDADGLRSWLHGAALTFGLGALAGLVPMGALMTCLAYATRGRRSASFVRCIAAGLRAFGPMLVLLVLAGLAQAVVLVAGVVLAHGVEGWTHASLGEARAQQLEGLVVLAVLGFASVLGVIHDLARAAVVRFHVRGTRALVLGARAWRAAPLSSWWSWAWRAACGVAPVLVVGGVASRLGGRGGFALAFLFVLHQAVVLARVALRTSWLARALRGVDAALRRAR